MPRHIVGEHAHLRDIIEMAAFIGADVPRLAALARDERVTSSEVDHPRPVQAPELDYDGDELVLVQPDVVSD